METLEERRSDYIFLELLFVLFQQYKQKNRCGLCLRGFYAEKRYWKHMEQHSSSQIFNCSRCNETFVEESVLVEHWGSHEGQLPHFLCSVC
jgi:hypothetical protein